jgi:hypothetical protein
MVDTFIGISELYIQEQDSRKCLSVDTYFEDYYIGHVRCEGFLHQEQEAGQKVRGRVVINLHFTCNCKLETSDIITLSFPDKRFCICTEDN